MGKLILEKLNLFFSKYKILKYKKGEVLLRSGDEPRGVFFLVKGFVRLYSLSKAGEEFTLIIFKSGEIFPLTWLISDIPNVYNFSAIGAVEVKRAPREDLLKYISGSSDLYRFFLDEALLRLWRILRRMEYLVFGNAQAKVASILLILGEGFGKKIARKIKIGVPLTHYDIANLVGLSRETISIEMGKLADKGLISYKGKLITIKNLVALKKESLLDVES